MKRSHRLMGYLAILIVLFFTTKAQNSLSRSLRWSQREETEILIVANPINQLNPVVKNPYQDEYEQMLYPVVRITAGWSTGSGVIIATTDSHRYTQIYILTASHVVDNENTVNIELYDSTIITGTVIITDTAKDLALIKPQTHTDNTDKIYKARLAPKNYEAYLFSPVWAIGCSLGLEPRPSYGHITHIEKSNRCSSASICGYEISAPILPGNSGGPVYAESQRSPDNFGNAYTYEVIGIAVWVKVYDGQLVTTMAGVVPINQIYEFISTQIKQIQTDKSAQSAY